MKHLDSMIGPVKRGLRASLMNLRESKRFGIDLHLREHFAGFRAKFESIAASTGIPQKGYMAWLQKHQKVDSISSRHRYLIDFDNGSL